MPQSRFLNGQIACTSNDLIDIGNICSLQRENANDALLCFLSSWEVAMPSTRTAKTTGVALGLFVAVALSAPARAAVITWLGTPSSSIADSNNWSAPPTGSQAVGDDWMFPDAVTLGAGSTTPTWDGGGQWTVGGGTDAMHSGISILAGAPAYTFQQVGAANVLNLAGTTNTTATTNRGYVTNSSNNTQTFDMDFQSTRATIDALSADISFNSGHTFTTGGLASIASGNSTRTNNATITDHDLPRRSHRLFELLGGPIHRWRQHRQR